MKKSILRILAVAVFSVALVPAQQRGLGLGLGLGFGSGEDRGDAPVTDLATIAARQVRFLDHLLSLTAGQQVQATTIFTTAITAEQALKEQITTAQTALLAAIKANDAAAITTEATAVGNLRGQEIAIKAKASADLYALLTDDQKAKLDLFRNDGFLSLGLGLGRKGGQD